VMKLKKWTILIGVIILSLSMSACGNESDEGIENETNSVETESLEENTSIEVDENLLTVDITLPPSFFQDMTEDEIIADAKEEGYKSTKVNVDGSVTYTMSKAKRKEMLKGMKISIDESIEELLEGEERVESFVEIEHNDNLSKVDIYVDPELYSEWDSFYTFQFYMFGAFYQTFDGVATEEIDVIVNFIDNTTKDVLNTGSYKDFIAEE
jgi:hypothetical protein